MDIYQQEEIAVIAKHGDGRCLVRTTNGAPFAMPCCLERDHCRDHEADPETQYFMRPWWMK